MPDPLPTPTPPKPNSTPMSPGVPVAPSAQPPMVMPAPAAMVVRPATAIQGSLAGPIALAQVRPPVAPPSIVPPSTLPPKMGGPAFPPRPPVAGQAVAMAPGPQAPLPPRGAPAPLPSGTTAPRAPQVPAGASPQVAVPRRSSILRFLPLILGGLAIVALIIFLATRFLGGGSSPTSDGAGSAPTGGTTNRPQTTLIYWGLWEPSQVMDQVFRDFEQANPGIKISYVKQSHLDYRQRLQTAISQGNGPDVFRFHASWTPMLKDDLANMPSSVYTPATFQNTFYPAAYQQLLSSGQLKGVPLMYDGLALYYNEDMLKAANAPVPKTWAELRTLADSLTVRRAGVVERGGLAIGNASNVEHYADILGLLMLQNGADPTKPTSNEAEQALIFYTDFVKKYNVWGETLPNSTAAFARGDAAMMLAPSWRAHEVLAQNPSLKFGIAPVPQLSDKPIAWATFWAEGVNAKGKNRESSWKLLSYLSSAEVMKKMYSQQATVRRFGQLYSRRDLANELAGEPLVVPFLSDAANARGSYLSSFTHDNGINDLSIKYYQDAINAVLKGSEPKTALQTVSQGLNQVLRQYGVVTTQSTPAQQPSSSNLEI